MNQSKTISRHDQIIWLRVLGPNDTPKHFPVQRRKIRMRCKTLLARLKDSNDTIPFPDVSIEVMNCFVEFLLSGKYFHYDTWKYPPPNKSAIEDRERVERKITLKSTDIWDCILLGGRLECPAFQNEGLRVWYAKWLETKAFEPEEVNHVYSYQTRQPGDTRTALNFMANHYARGDLSYLFTNGHQIYPPPFLSMVIVLLSETLGPARKYMKDFRDPFTTVEEATGRIDDGFVVEIDENGDEITYVNA